MLVLSRKVTESIMIDDDTEVTVVEIRGNKVRLGIQAPKTKSVYRKEVWVARWEENNDGGDGDNSQ